ncbi:MAG: hypothetical protein A2Z59_05570 [Nitrospinae bacterium RIFCSPLOWO2_02_39_17]|nr:MAG: hypothetical protein A2Z59_05570 [Nitrospinae bacterium RIFCSPLOWO2_02_39_17]
MKRKRYSNPNDEYFGNHISEFVKEHGGEWVVIAGGELIGFVHKEGISRLVKKARRCFPKDIPLISPIPKEDELHYILFYDNVLCHATKNTSYTGSFPKTRRVVNLGNNDMDTCGWVKLQIIT